MAANDKSASQAKHSESEGQTSGVPSDDGKPVAITMLHGRPRHIGWLLFGGIGGGALVWQFGTIGQVVGLALLAVAAQQAYRLAQTLMRDPGTFRVDGDTVRLPTGLCSGQELSLTRDEVAHAYFLRRSVPWTQAGPLLVVEAKGAAYSFPRDWFASDSDQRRVEMALNRGLRAKAAEPANAS